VLTPLEWDVVMCSNSVWSQLADDSPYAPFWLVQYAQILRVGAPGVARPVRQALAPAAH